MANGVNVMVKGENIEERLIDFAVRAMHLCEKLPSNHPASLHIKRQLVRSATAPAPNYAEARNAESAKDFIHKLKIALKELNESRIWLKMIIRAGLVKEALLSELLDECEQLCRILSSSIKTVKNRS